LPVCPCFADGDEEEAARERLQRAVIIRDEGEEEVAADEYIKVLSRRGLEEGDSADERAEDGAAKVVPRYTFLDHAHVLADDVEDCAASDALPRELLLRSLELVLEAVLAFH
jgi:hypothetical protein